MKSVPALAPEARKRAKSLPTAVLGDKNGESSGFAPSPPPLRMNYKTALLSLLLAASHGKLTSAEPPERDEYALPVLLAPSASQILLKGLAAAPPRP